MSIKAIKNTFLNLTDSPFKKGFILVLIFTMLLQVFYLDPTNVFSVNASLRATASVYSGKTPSDLIMILVEESAFEDNTDYSNQLTENYSEVRSSDIRSRVERYAQDIQINYKTYANSDDLEVSIVPVSKFQSPESIATMLKQSYFQNLNQLQDTSLKGLVLIGDVPLPIVNKNGNLFPSVYPYIDFEEPAYSFDSASSYFLPNQVLDPIPEIWHGIIDLSTTDQLAEYLDKNHLHYSRNPDYADFEKNIFFSEPSHDANSFNQDLYTSYLTYNALIEEFAYNRYSRKLLDFLNQNSSGFVAQAIQTGQATQGLGLDVPDIFTKPSVESFVTPITDVFTVALREQRDKLLSTGRYQDSEFTSGLLGIAKIDELSSLYLKEVNQLVENEIDNILDDVQQDINLTQGAKLTPVLEFTNQDGDIITQQEDPIYFVNHSRQEDLLQFYLNTVPGLSQLPTEEAIDTIFGDLSPLSEVDLITNASLKINGTKFTDINTPAQCRVFRGGGTDNVLDKTVRTHRGLVLNRDPEAIPQQPVCYKPYDKDNPEETWTTVNNAPGFLGLFDNVYNCTTFAGENLQDFHRMDEVNLDVQSPLTAQSCYGMRITEDYVDLLKVQYSSPSNLQESVDQLNSIPDYQNLNLVNYNNQNITLGQVLGSLPGYRSVQLSENDTFDWHAFSSQILANPVKKSFKINLDSTQNPELESLTLQIEQYETAKTIPSLIKHADPTPGVISNAYDTINPDLPINATRYVTFTDKNGNTQELIYPNLFKSNSFQDFQQKLTQLESVLSSLSKSNQDYTGQLTSLIASSQDEYQNQILTNANPAKVEFLAGWLNYDLNQKYEQSHQLLLSSNPDFSLNNLPKSYEIAHITGQTVNQNLDFNILDFADFDLITPDSNSLAGKHKEQTQVENILSKQASPDESVDLFTYFTDYLPSWYEEQQQKVSRIISPDKPEPQNIDLLFGSDQVQPDQVQVNSERLLSIQGQDTNLSLTLVNNEGVKSLQNLTQTITTNLPAAIQESIDQDSQTEGIQINYFGGVSSLSFEAPAVGEYQIQFPTNTYTFQVYQNPTLQISSSTNSVQVGQDSSVNIEVKLVDGSTSIPFPKPNLQIESTLSSPAIEYLGQNPNLDTTHNYRLQVGTKSGQIIISSNILSEGLAADSYFLEVTSGPVQNIQFTNSNTKITSRSLSLVDAILIDEFQNPVLQSSSNYQISYDDSQKLSQFPDSVQFNQGKASLEFQSIPNTFGNIFLEITSQDQSVSGVHKLTVSSELDLQEVGANMNSLILNLFTDQSGYGADYANSILQNSKVQSLSTLSTNLASQQPLLYIHPSGGLLLPDNSPVQSSTSFQTGVFKTIFTDSLQNQIVELSLNTSTKQLVEASQSTSTDELILEIINPDLLIDQNSVFLNSEQLIVLNPDQSIQSFSDQVDLTISNDNQYTVFLTYQGQPQLKISFNPSSSNQVSIKPSSRNPNVLFEIQQTLPSSNQPLGYKFYNPKVELTEDQLPQSLSFRSENALTNPHVGLIQGSKVLHLLSSSVPVGEANRPHLSEAGIVLGDPMIRLNRDLNSSTSNMSFNDTLGKYITRKQDSKLVDIVSLPSLNKTAVAYQDGTVGMLDNQTLRYTEEIINVPNGIKSIHVAEFQEDQETLVFQTDQACTEGDSCIYVFNTFEQDEKVGVIQLVSPNLTSQEGYELDRNQLSSLNRLDLDLDAKVSQILIHDMNNDGKDDLIAETEDQVLNLFWNQDGQIQSTPNQLGQTRIGFEEDEYLLQKVLLGNYPTSQPQTAKLNIPTEAQENIGSFETPSGTIQSQQITTSQELSLINLTALPSLASSTARIRDIDGNTLEDNDLLEYSIFVSNSSLQTIQDLSLSVPIPQNQILINDSLSPSDARFTRTTDTNNRQFLIQNLSLSPNGTTTIRFQTRYQRPSISSDSIIQINQPDQENILPVQDGYPDLKILLPEADYVTYFYSDYNQSSNVLSFNRLDIEQQAQASNPNESVLESFLDLPTNPSSSQQESIANSLAEQAIKKDSDNDGIIDIYDGTGSLDTAGSAVEGALKDLSCGDGGCLAVPYNEAFLVPGDIPGTELPAFAWGCPPLPTGGFVPFWPPQPFQSCSGGRIYVSPTLTGELAGSVCIGPHRAGACFTFSITDLGELCDKINKSVQDVITKATDFAETSSGGVITVGGSSGQNQQSNIQIPGFPAVLIDWLTNQWKEVNKKLVDLPDINIIYPDPESIVGYVTPISQQDDRNFFFTDPYPECISSDVFSTNPEKCGDLSSYNDVLVAKQNSKSRSEFNSADDLQSVLEEIALMPLFDINYETVYISYPDIDESEFTKYKTELTNLGDQIKLEFFATGSQWGCFANTDFDSIASMQTALDEGNFLQSMASSTNVGGNVQSACLRVAAGLEGIDLNIKENLSRIQEYRELPKNIVRLENFVANYADQILQYAETVLSSTLGWLSENTNALIQWEQAIHEVEQMVGDLRILLDFSADFMESCDDCRNNRTNDGIESLISIFASLSPELPVIEIPSWPDITLDVSEVKAGIDITLPEFKLKKDPITLPDLNLQFRLPETPEAALGLPGSGNNIDGFNLELYLQAFEVPLLPEPPNLDELALFDDLPELPELEIPQIPSLPKPPSIKNFTGDFTQKVEPTIEVLTRLVRIYCLIAKGIVPMPENQIKDQIETMTNRPLTPVLPVDLSFQLPSPDLEYQYLEEVVFKLTTQLNFEFDEIQTNSAEIADYLNSFSSGIADSVEDGLQENFSFLNAGEVNVLGDELTNTIENIQAPESPEAIDLTGLTSLSDSLVDLKSNFDQINQAFPDDINLKATSSKYIPTSGPSITLQEYKSNPLLLAKAAKSNSNPQFASTNAQSQTPPNKSENFDLVSKTIAQATSPTSQLGLPTFDPEDGIYTVDQQGTVQKLIAYNSTTQAQNQVEIVDLDKDGDEDIVYSLENSLYVKTNDHVSSQPSYRSSSARVYDFEDLLDGFDANSIQTSSIDFNFSHNQVFFNLPSHLTRQDLALDVYKLALDSSEEYQRYHISPEESDFNLDEASFDKVIKITNQSTVSVPLSNGNYIARLSIIEDNQSYIIQSNIALAPNTCGDNIPPNIQLNSDQEVDVPLFSSYTVDLSRSYDSDSSISQFYIDNNLRVDTDQDGDATNDKIIQGQDNLASSIFQLGPFNEIQSRRYQIHATDINGNIATQLLTLNVIPPDITITKGADNQIDGQLNPISGNTPITLVRQRDGILSPLAELETDSNGQFQFTPTNQSDSIIIKDINQRELFRVNKQTGTIQSLDPQAQLEFNPFTEGSNTSITLNYNGQQLTIVQKVADSALPSLISSQPVQSQQLDDLSVHVQDTNSSSWTATSVDNQIVISNSTDPSLTISSSGQFTLLDDSITIEVSDVNNIDELQTFDVYADSIKQFAVYVNVPNELDVQDPTEIIQPSTRTITFTPPKPDFQDIDESSNSFEAIQRLQDLGIIEGVRRGNQVFFEPEREIQRSEFSKIILEALCLAPSPQSKLPPQAFSDIPYNQNDPLWYYDYTKETQLLGLFNGYLAEQDPQTNLFPFKPSNDITLAEASKVILEALEYKSIIQFDLPTNVDGPWYTLYLQISQDLTPYITQQAAQTNSLLNNQLLTQSEIQNPNKTISREEFAIIASRVLDLHNCFELESNSDNTNDDDQSNQDQDGDGSNQGSGDENQEIGLVFPNPGRPGLYINQIACNTCPCGYTIDDENDIIKRDIIFAVLLGPNDQIYSQSNTLTITQ